MENLEITNFTQLDRWGYPSKKLLISITEELRREGKFFEKPSLEQILQLDEENLCRVMTPVTGCDIAYHIEGNFYSTATSYGADDELVLECDSMDEVHSKICKWIDEFNSSVQGNE